MVHEVLVIEDDVRIANLVKRGLEEGGYHVTVAYDGISGKKLALQHDYAPVGYGYCFAGAERN